MNQHCLKSKLQTRSVITFLFLLLSLPVYTQTKWYTYNNSNDGLKDWNSPSNWTLSASGSYENDALALPSNGDEIYVKDGVKLYLNTSVAITEYSLLDIANGSSLTIASAVTGAEFDIVRGEGDIIVENENSIPTGSFTDIDRGFSNTGQGTLIFDNDTDLTLNAHYTFSSFVKRGAGDLVVKDLTINDQIKIEEGSVTLSNSSTVVVYGDILLAESTSISDNGSSRDITLYGDFLNKGDVEFGNSTLFFKGANDQIIEGSINELGTVKGSFEVNNIELEKDLKQQTVLLKSGEKSTFVINHNEGTNDNLLEHLIKGTLILGDEIEVDLNKNKTNDHCTLSEDVILELNSVTASAYMGINSSDNGGSKALALLLYGEIHVKSGTLNMLRSLVDPDESQGPDYGIVIYERGKMLIEEGGVAKMRQFRTSYNGADHQGEFKITGGVLRLYNWYDDQQPFSLPYSTTSFIMTGGEIIMDGTHGNTALSERGILIATGDGNYNVSDNAKITIITKENQEILIGSVAPLPNLTIEGEGHVSVQPIKFRTKNDGDITIDEDLKIVGTLEVSTEFYTGDHTVEISRDLKINKEDAFTYKSSNSDYKRNQSTIIFNGSTPSQINLNYDIVSDDDAEDNEIYFYNLILDKDVTYDGTKTSDARLSLIAHESHTKASDTDYKGNYVGGQDGDQNDSNIMRVMNELDVKNGLINQSDYSIRIYTNEVNIGATGQLGYYESGVTPKQALIKLRPSDQIINVEEGGKLGNLKINADDNRLTFTGDTHIQRGFYRHGTIYIGRNELKFDELDLLGKLGTFVEDTKTYNNFIMTDGSDSDKGVSIRIDENTARNRSANGSGNLEVVYPIGYQKADGTTVYDPIRLEFESDGMGGFKLPSVEEGGFISVSAVASKLTIADNDYDLTPFYWKVERENFDDTSITNYPKVKFVGHIDVDDFINYGFSETEIESVLFPGKVLNGDELTANRLSVDLGRNISIYERNQVSSNNLSKNNPRRSEGYVADSFYEIPFENDWEGNENFISIENASLTVGASQAFIGSPKIFYWRVDESNEEGYSWTDNTNWKELLSDGSFVTPAASYPLENDVVFIDVDEMDLVGTTTDGIPGIHIKDGDDVACSRLNFDNTDSKRSRIFVTKNSSLTADVVNGQAEFMVYYFQTSSENGNLYGDYGNWADQENSLLNARMAESGIIPFTKPDGVDVFPNVMFNGSSIDNQCYIGFEDFNSKSLTISNLTTLLIGYTSDNKAINLEETFQLGAWRKGALIFTNNVATSTTINCLDFVLNNYQDATGASTYCFADNGKPDVEHFINISGDLIILKGAGNLSNTFINWSSEKTKVTTSFNGNSNSTINHDIDYQAFTNAAIKFGKVKINKENLENEVSFISYVEFLDPTSTTLTNENKNFVLNTGTAILNNENISLDLNKSGTMVDYDFIIPTTAKLSIQNGSTIRVTGEEAGIQLNGVLELIGGSAYLNTGNASDYNFIEYGSSGDAAIHIENVYQADGVTPKFISTLDIGGQIRVNRNTNAGVLSFTHNSGIVTIGGQDIPTEYEDMGVLHLLGDENAQFRLNFNYIVNENSFTVKGGSGLDDAAYFIDTENYVQNNLIYGENARWIIDTSEATDFNVFISNLPFLDIQDGSITFITDVTVLNAVNLETAAEIHQVNNTFTLLNGTNINNDGQWTATAGAHLNFDFDEGSEGTVTYTGSDIDHDFYNLSVNQGKLQFVGPFVSTSIDINEELFVATEAELDLDGDGDAKGVDVRLKGANQSILGRVSSSNTSDGGYYIVFDAESGIIQQLTSDIGEFDNMEISVPNGLYLDDISPENAFYSLKINKDLKFDEGIFFIEDNTLMIGSEASLSSTGAFDENKMIVLNGELKDGGVIKEFVGKGLAGFTFPIGTEINDVKKYSPIVLDLSGNTSVGDSEQYLIKVLALDYFYPSLVKSDVATPKVLDYTWLLYSLDVNGNETAVPDNFEGKVSFSYFDQDILQTTADESTYSSVVFYEGSLAWQRESGVINEAANTVTFDLSKTNVLNLLNDGNLTGIYTIGASDDMSAGIQKYVTKTGLANPIAWNSDASWNKIPLNKTGDQVIMIDGNPVTFPIYEEGTPVAVDADEYPSSGSIVAILENVEVNLGTEYNLELSSLIIDGKLIIDQEDAANNYALSNFGEVSGTGILEMQGTTNKPDGNWLPFFNETTGGEIILNLSNTNSNFLSGIAVSSIINDGPSLKKLTLKVVDDAGNDTKIPFTLNNTNITLGAFDVNENANLSINGSTITVNEDFLVNEAILSIDDATTITQNGDFIVQNNSTVNLNGKINLSKDLTITDNTSSFLPTITSVVSFQGGEVVQNVKMSGNNLGNVIIDKENSNDIVDFTDPTKIRGYLTFIRGKAKSGSRSKKGSKVVGNLTIEQVQNITGFSEESYILGHTKFVTKAGSQGNILFPIGNATHFYPIGLSVETLPVDVTWVADYIDHEDNTLPTESTKIPLYDSGSGPETLRDADGREVKAIQNDGRWILEPYFTEDEVVVANVLKFITKAQKDYTGLSEVDKYRTTLKSTGFNNSDENYQHRILGGATSVLTHNGVTVIKSGDNFMFYGKGAAPANFYIAAFDPNHGGGLAGGRINAGEVEFANDGFQWAYVDEEIVETPELPVELISFTAHVTSLNTVRLNWATASETNNDYFTVEKSKDGKRWFVVEEIEGAGNSNVQLTYKTTDHEPYNGISYYRLVQYDFDGQYEVFEAVQVNLNRNGNQAKEVLIYPNPVTGTNLNIELIGFDQEKVQIGIYNHLGVIIKSSTEEESTFDYDVSDLPNGVYFLKIIHQQEQIVKKIIIK